MKSDDIAARRGFLGHALGYGAVAAGVGAAAVSTKSALAQGSSDEVVALSDYDALKAYTGASGTVQVLGANFEGDGGSGLFRYVSGAASGTYADNGGTVLLPSGGNGSAAWLRVYQGAINIRWFGAHPDVSATHNADSIQDALDAAGENDVRIEVFVPHGTYEINKPLSVPRGVSLYGAGGTTSHIKAVSCDAIRYSFNSGYENTVLRDLYIEGTSSDTVLWRGISAPGTGDEEDELYGLTIQNCLVKSFHVGIEVRTVRNFTFVNNWIENVDEGIKIVGQSLVGYIAFNKIVRASGNNGPATPTAILLDSHTYSTTSYIGAPEGIQILSNQFFGFNTGINAVFVRFLNIHMNDFKATVKGISFQTVPIGLNIKDNYIEMSGAAAGFGIEGKGLNNPIDTHINIEGNTIFGFNVVGCSGIQINAPTNQYQDHVRIVRNVIDGMASYDILLNNPGPSSVKGNRCLSTNVTKSIKSGSVQLKPVFIIENFCESGIEFSTSDVSAQNLIARDNIVSGTTWL